MSTVTLTVSYDVNGPSGSGFDMRTITFSTPVGGKIDVQTTSIISASSDALREVFTITGHLISTTPSIIGNSISSLVYIKAGSAVPETNYISPSITYQVQDMNLDFGVFLHTTSANRLAYVMSGDDTVTGTQYNDILFGGTGNDTINGGVGTDTVIYSGARANFTITSLGASYIIKDNVSTEGVDTLVNVERVKFGDTSIALDISGIAGQVYRLYNAAFHRAPDLGGLGFWIATSDNGMNLTSVSKEFINSAEFNQKYGSLDNSGFVTQLYANVLNRTPDKGGLDYWVGQINSSALTQEQVLIGFSESPENQTNVIGLIGNGIQYTHWG